MKNNMKHLFMKISGISNTKDFYLKYPTEAAFLKAHPKAKAELQKFALGGIDANRQTYPKTITYTPQEWHQKNILAGNVMLGKNNDLNTMFKNNIYPQYTLPNDTVPINYSPVVKQLPMPQGFVDNSKRTFNYAAGQQLPKQANGGQMNTQSMQQFAGGGFFQDAGEGIGNYFKAVADTTLGTFGASNVIKDSDYSGYGANEMSNLNKTLQPITSTAAPLIAGAIGGPAAGMLVSSGQQLIGGFNPEDNTGLDENGNPKNPDAAKYQKAGQTIAQLGSFGAQAYDAFGSSAGKAGKSAMKTGITTNAGNSSGNFLNPSNMMGQTQFGYAKYGGQMKYAMGGEIQYANGGTGEISAEVEGGGYNQNGYNQDGENAIGPNGEFTQFSGPTHAQGGIETDMAPGTMIFSDKLKMPGSKKSFAALNKLYDTNKEDNVLSNEKSNNTLKLTAMLMRDAKLKQSLALFQEQEQFKQDKVAAYAKRMGVQIPSQDNEQMEPQGMPEQSEGEYKNGGIHINPANKGKFTASAEHAGMGVQAFANHVLANKEDYSSTQVKRANFAHNAAGWKHEMGGIQESDYQTDPGNLSSLLRQKRANDAALLGIRSSFGPKDDTTNVKDNLVVTLNKAKDFDKELTNKINNHPEFKKAMGGRLPMYQYGDYTGYIPKNPNPIYMKGYTEKNDNYNQNNPLYGNYIKGYSDNYNQDVKPPDEQVFGNSDENLNFNNYNIDSFSNSEYNPNYKFPHNEMNRYLNDANIAMNDANIVNSTLQGKINPNAGSPSVDTYTKVDPKIKGEGFDYKKAAGNLGQYALQNAGNIYDLYRSTQDNSKLNLARYSPNLLDKTQDLANNQRMYSEGKRQTAEASQGNASTYLNNMYANRASKLANDLNVNTTYGNLNAQIANAAKLYNAGAIDKETMFKLQAEGMNRNLKGQALAGMSQNFINQRNSDRQDDLDQQRLDLQKQYYKAFYDNQDRENQRRVDEITKGKSNKNSWLDCSSGNCVERTSDQTQSTQSTPLYFNQTERPDNWDAVSRLQEAQDKMDKLKKGKK